MPDHIVQNFRQIFWDYVAPHLPLPKQPLRIPAFFGHIGFQNSFIIINPHGQTHPKIWATNAISRFNGYYHGYIDLNPDLFSQPADFVYRIIAREWIEVMTGLRDAPNSIVHAKVSQNHELILVLEQCRQSAIWVDPPEQEARLEAAVSELLVSAEDIRRYALMLGLEIPKLSQRLQTHNSDAANDLLRIVREFCRIRPVPIDIVWERIQHLLGLR